MKKVAVLMFVMVAFMFGTSANALLVNLGPGSFDPLAPQITFDEVPLGTHNPVYDFGYLEGLGDMTVSFGGHFIGQSVTGSGVVTLDDNTPEGPLALDPNAPDVYTAHDGATPTSPTLSGTPLFNGVISVLFSNPVAGVGLSGGYFNAIGATTIEAYDASGTVLGSITNSQLGIEFYGLADDSGANVISGISFYITGNEPAGFVIDNLTFGAAADIPDINGEVPEPGTLLLLGSGLVGLVALGRKKFLRK